MPEGFEGQVAALTAAAGRPGPEAGPAARALAEGLTALCRAEGLA